MHGWLTPVVKDVLARMGRVADIETAAFDASDEWLRVTSGSASDYELFQKLRFRWPLVAGIAIDKVALVYCRTDPHAGLWLHDLSADAARNFSYAGCYEVAAWNQQRARATSSAVYARGKGGGGPRGGVVGSHIMF